jgi:hypothetical protein
MGEPLKDATEEVREEPETAAKVDSSWATVDRFDLASGDLGERKTTSQGGMIARANMTRTGVLTYVQSDGTTRRELRHPDEVFDPRSLATLAHATLTDDHPDEVTPANWKKVAIGHVAGTPHKAGKFVQGEIHIQHDAAIEKAGKGKLQELSTGYKCAIDPTPGVYEGEPYDAVQRHIRYNHVAAGPPGWGRAGPDVRMHLDGGAAVSGGKDSARDGYVRDMPDLEEEKKRADAEKVRADAAEAELVKLRADALKNDGELVGLRKLQAQQTAAQTAATEALRNDASFDEQLEAIEAASRFLGGKWQRKRADGVRKTVEEIRREVVKHLQPSWKTDGLPDGAIHGMYLAAAADAEKARQGRLALHAASSPLSMFVQDKGTNPFANMNMKKKPDEDGDEDTETADAQTKMAQDRMFQKQKDAWKLPKRDRKNRMRPDSGALVPGRAAFSGGNPGGNFSGGFGGGM